MLHVLKRWISIFVNREFARGAQLSGHIETTFRASVLNHGDKTNGRLGRHVVIDGTLECYERGELSVGDYSFIGKSRIFAAHKINIGTGVLISDNVVILDSDLHSLSASKRLAEAVAWS